MRQWLFRLVFGSPDDLVAEVVASLKPDVDAMREVVTEAVKWYRASPELPPRLDSDRALWDAVRRYLARAATGEKVV
jgi:hypothetical protein